MNTEEKGNANSEVVVERTFRVERSGVGELDAAIEKLLKVPGVAGVEQLGARPGIRLRYDTRELDAAAVLQRLRDLGIRPAGGMWQRWRSAWLTMLDGNIRDNAAHHPACCSKPPPGAGKGLTGRRH